MGLDCLIQLFYSLFSEDTKNQHQIGLNKADYLSKERIERVCRIILFAILQ